MLKLISCCVLSIAQTRTLLKQRLNISVHIQASVTNTMSMRRAVVTMQSSVHTNTVCVCEEPLRQKMGQI